MKAKHPVDAAPAANDSYTATVDGKVGLAIDVGFGRVKFSRRTSDRQGVEFLHFPSMVIPAEQSIMRELGRVGRDTFNVPVNGALYEVGLDIELAQTGGDFGREITDEFYRGPIYEVLTKGALRYMDEKVIDILVLGLPVNQYKNTDRVDYLKQHYTGTVDLGDGKSVEIKEVVVRPQPLGGYLELGSHLEALNATIGVTKGALQPLASVDALAELTVLNVDPGEHTLDWLLIRRGDIATKASDAASDAGRHRIVEAVQKALQAKIGRPLGPATLPLINAALRLGTPLKLAGQAYDLSEFDAVIQAEVEDTVNRLIQGVRGMHELIDLIVIFGGHPDRYARALRDRFPFIPVFVIEGEGLNSIEANVRGFQQIASALLLRDQQLSKQAA